MALANDEREGARKTGTYLGHVLLYVADLARAKRFYEDVVGLRPVFEEAAHAILVGANGVTLGLNVNSELAGPGKGVQVDFEVPDVDAAYTRIRMLAPETEPPVTQPWGLRHLYLTDPDGRKISIFMARTAKPKEKH